MKIRALGSEREGDRDSQRLGLREEEASGSGPRVYGWRGLVRLDT